MSSPSSGRSCRKCRLRRRHAVFQGVRGSHSAPTPVPRVSGEENLDPWPRELASKGQIGRRSRAAGQGIGPTLRPGSVESLGTGLLPVLSPSPVTPKNLQGEGSWVPGTHAGGKSKGTPESCERGEEAAVGRRRGARSGGEGWGTLQPPLSPLHRKALTLSYCQQGGQEKEDWPPSPALPAPGSHRHSS